MEKLYNFLMKFLYCTFYQMCRWNCWEAKAGQAGCCCCCCCCQSCPAGHHRSSVMHLLSSSFKVNCLLLCTASDIMTLQTRVKTQYLHTPSPSLRVRQWAAQGGHEEHSTMQHDVHSFRHHLALSWDVPVTCCTMRPFIWVSLDVLLIILVCHKLVCLAVFCVIPSFILYSYFVFPSASSVSALSGLRQTIEMLCVTCSRCITLVSHMSDSWGVSCIWGEPEVPAEEWPCGSRVPQGCHVVEWLHHHHHCHLCISDHKRKETFGWFALRIHLIYLATCTVIMSY